MSQQSEKPLRAPEPLHEGHQVDAFQCGVPSLDTWIRRRAGGNQKSGASRTFVACRGEQVRGYYALAAGSVDHELVPSRTRRNMPNPIPVVVFARLAVATDEQGAGIGRALVRDALFRIRAAADEIGVAAVLVHALNDGAKQFYLTCGFAESPINPLILVARLKDIEVALARSARLDSSTDP